MTPHDLFAIERHQLAQLAQLATRLYSENRMNGDEMRNAAQLLDSVVRGAIELPDDGGRS
jgi:hypothetical protein